MLQTFNFYFSNREHYPIDNDLLILSYPWSYIILISWSYLIFQTYLISWSYLYRSYPDDMIPHVWWSHASRIRSFWHAYFIHYLHALDLHLSLFHRHATISCLSYMIEPCPSLTSHLWLTLLWLRLVQTLQSWPTTVGSLCPSIHSRSWAQEYQLERSKSIIKGLREEDSSRA